FDSIVVFGNFPQEELGEELGGVQATESVEQGNYPLTFAVDLETTLKIEAEFSTAAFDAVTVERSLDQLVVVLTAVAERPQLAVAFQGGVRSGGVYVPINPGLPAERLAFLLADVTVAVTTAALAGELAAFGGQVLVLDGTVAGALPVRIDPNALAYIAYTSGS